MKEGTSRNLPCELGGKLGKETARLTRNSLDKLRKSIPDYPDTCKTCAFREGTVANRCLSTQGDALKCALEGVPFFCHESKNCEGLCVGYSIWHDSGPSRATIKAPWPFTGVDKGGL